MLTETIRILRSGAEQKEACHPKRSMSRSGSSFPRTKITLDEWRCYRTWVGRWARISLPEAQRSAIRYQRCSQAWLAIGARPARADVFNTIWYRYEDFAPSCFFDAVFRRLADDWLLQRSPESATTSQLWLVVYSIFSQLYMRAVPGGVEVISTMPDTDATI